MLPTYGTLVPGKQRYAHNSTVDDANFTGAKTMPNNSAAIWSAVAASFAALSSFLMMLIQRRNLMESVRPEMVLTGWSRREEGQGDAAHEVIAIQMIKNVGRGPALNIMLTSGQPVVADRSAPALAYSFALFG